jgi:hypothetical protein
MEGRTGIEPVFPAIFILGLNTHMSTVFLSTPYKNTLGITITQASDAKNNDNEVPKPLLFKARQQKRYDFLGNAAGNHNRFVSAHARFLNFDQ